MQQLYRIRGTLDKLNSGYEDVKQQMIAAQTGTGPTLSEFDSLIAQRDQVGTKQKILGAFQGHFTMSEDEIVALTITAEPVDNRFFDALAKSKKISKDCEVLLGFEKQTLGLELMEQTSKNINLGFQKLYKWIQREFKTLNLENPQMNPSIRRALRVLAERPTLFQNCLDFFSQARERILSDTFYAALTGSSSSGLEDRSSKPIDMTAHDPLRYVGDMLAWIHSATVSEREALEVLFVAEGEELAKGLKSGRDAEIWRLVADDNEDEGEFDALKALNDLVDRDLSAAVRVLRQRVEQVIQSNEEIVPAYKLANLLGFYQVTFDKLLGPGSNLLESMGLLQVEAMRQFRALVREHIATLQGEFQQTPSNLGPPHFLQESLKQLDAFMQTYDSALSTLEDREAGFEDMLIETFDPFMSGCDNMAKAIRAPDDAIFLINCRVAAASTLEKFDFTHNRLRQLREKTEADAQSLASDQFQFFRRESGLEQLFIAIEDERPDTDKIMDVQALAEASHQLDDFLPSAWMDAIERLRHMQDSTLARQVTEQAAEQFCSTFEKLEHAVVEANERRDENEGSVGELRTAFPRTTAEIRVLLS